MKFQTVWTIIYLIAISTLGFNLLTEELNAQNTNTQSVDIAIDDQARYLQNLKSRSISQWAFGTQDRTENLANYSLDSSQSDIKITEQKVSEWGNTGEPPNYSVVVDVYEFDAEDID